MISANQKKNVFILYDLRQQKMSSFRMISPFLSHTVFLYLVNMFTSENLHMPLLQILIAQNRVLS